MSYRVDFTLINATDSVSRFGLSLHNLTDVTVSNWTLHFVLCRQIKADTINNGSIKQIGNYCQFIPNTITLLGNSIFYTEFDINMSPFNLLDDGITEAFLSYDDRQQSSVQVTTMDMGHCESKRFTTPLPPIKKFNLVPLPQQVTPLNGHYPLTHQCKISHSAPEALNAIEWLTTELHSQYQLELTPHDELTGLHCQRNEQLNHEEYHLLIEENAIWLEANNSSGFHNGMASLLQLITTSIENNQTEYVLPMVEIHDRPYYGYRGMMLDCSRHFHPIDRIKKLLDQLAYYKFNTFHWHLTDDESWRIEIDAYPELTEIGAWRGPKEILGPQFSQIEHRYGGYYTKQEVRDLIEYARIRNIEIIPEIDIPGHCRAAIYSLPHLLQDKSDQSEYLSIQGYPDNILSPGLSGTYTFIQTVLQEICDLFPSSFVHIGGDEVPKGVWEKSPSCLALMKEHNYQDPAELQGHVLRFAEEILAGRGKRMMGWEEARHGNKVSTNTVIFSWLSEQAGLEGVEHSFDVVMQPAQYTYLDLAQGHSPDEWGVDWAGKVTLDTAYSYSPLAELPDEDPKHQKILGIQTALWSELINSQSRFDYMIYPRLLAIAEISWTHPKLRDWEDFKARLHGQLQHLDKAGIQYRHCE